VKLDHELPEVATLTTALAKYKTLRSEAVVIKRLLPLIDRASDAVHKRETIHVSTISGALEISLGIYRQTLYRVRTRANSGSKRSETPASPIPITALEDVGSSGSTEPKGRLAGNGRFGQRPMPDVWQGLGKGKGTCRYN
jgi:hypothetical protein